MEKHEELDFEDSNLFEALVEAEENSEQEATEGKDARAFLQKLDLKRVNKIFKKEEIKESSNGTTTKKASLINEEYLQNLVYTQVEEALDSFSNQLIDKILLNIQQIIEQSIKK